MLTTRAPKLVVEVLLLLDPLIPAVGNDGRSK
jgi:hypothetical protein